MTVTIPWTTGTGNIYLTYTESGGVGVAVTVSSDVNSLSTGRCQAITFTTNVGSKSVTVFVNQQGKGTEVSVGLHPVNHDETDHAYYSASGLSNGYTDSSSTSYATINLTRGKGATTYVYFGFDTSSIPDGAEIVSVACTVKCYISNTSSSYIATRQVQLFSGTTAKGSATTVANNTTVQTMSAGTWTLAELRNARIRVYGVRGNNNQNTNYYFRFYGATMTVTYRYRGRDFSADFNPDFG